VVGEDAGARIVVRDGQGEREIALDRRLSMGRAPDGELVLQEPRASRSHAQIWQVSAGRYRIRDLGSLNGTYVNGQRIGGARDLFHGDEIQIGSASLRFLSPGCVRAEAPAIDPLRPEPQSAVVPEEPLVAQRLAVLAVSVRSYGSLAEKLPRETLAEFMHGWHHAAGERARGHGALVDDPIDGGVLVAAWPAPGDGVAPLESALRAARDVQRCAGEMARAFRDRFEIGFFEVGAGIEVGEGLLGSGQPPSVGGAVVGTALALADLTKDKGYAVLVSAPVGQAVGPLWAFHPLGDLDLGEGPLLGVLALELAD
jgi:class 3 adenylate cyclase